jgi:[acyl-carrier-protein] S-malonyltransferase
MGKALAEARPEAAAVFAEIDEALGEKLSAIIFEGPAETLTLTPNAQPALMAVSIAAYRVLLALAGELPASVTVFAGHSLGEYAALVAAGSLDLADAARLLRLRGEAMQRAVPAGEGAMAAIIGLEPDVIREIAAAAAGNEVCAVANDNGGTQIVVSGHKAAIDRAVAEAKSRGARRTVILQVSGPFHSPLMAPAAMELEAAIAKVTVRHPSRAVMSNVTAMPHGDPDSIRARLVEQITGTVRWQECVAWMAAHGADRFFELGSGKVLTGLSKRIAPAAEAASAEKPEEIAAIAARLA